MSHVIKDPKTLKSRIGSGYPAPHDAMCAGREKRALGDAAGLKNFGVNYTVLPPGQAWRSATGTGFRMSSSGCSKARLPW
jgi:uncharacterized cupin superfamily protein